MSPVLISALQRLRDQLGKPIKITSGFRCPKSNEKAGGKMDSQHLYGKACDCHVPGMDLVEFFKKAILIADFEKGGIGIYPQEGILHLDVRGKIARWARVDGKYVGINEGLKKWKEQLGPSK